MDSSILLMVFYGILVLVVVLMGYWFLRMVITRRDLLSEQAKVSQQQESVIKEARQVANNIINEAKSQAQEIDEIRDAVLQSYQLKLSQTTNEVLQSYSKDIKKQLGPVAKELAASVVKTSDENKKIMQEFVDTYRQDVKRMTEDLSSELQSYSESAREKIDTDMAVYRTKLKEAMEKDISNSVKELSLKIFSQSLSVENHEELVRKAVETAKKEGLFN